MPKERYFVGISSPVQRILIDNSDPYNCINVKVVAKVLSDLEDQCQRLKKLASALFLHERKGDYPLVVHHHKKGFPYIAVSGPDQFLRDSFIDEHTPPHEKPNVVELAGEDI